MVWESKTVNWNSCSLTLNNHSLYGYTLDDSIFKLDFINGKTEWKRASIGSYATLSPVVSGNRIYFGGAVSLKACINIHNRKTKWEILNHGSLNSEAIFDKNSVYYNADASYVKGYTFKINLKTGKQIWQRITNPEIFFKPIIYKNKIFINSYTQAYSV